MAWGENNSHQVSHLIQEKWVPHPVVLSQFVDKGIIGVQAYRDHTVVYSNNQIYEWGGG